MENPLKPTAGLEYLLNLDGEIFPMETGYWLLDEVRSAAGTCKEVEAWQQTS